jgi:hypothetical protein
MQTCMSLNCYQIFRADRLIAQTESVNSFLCFVLCSLFIVLCFLLSIRDEIVKVQKQELQI